MKQSKKVETWQDNPDLLGKDLINDRCENK